MNSSRRWRIHHWSPWASDNSGITNYCEHLVPELARHVDVTVVHPHAVDPVFRTRRPHDVANATLDGGDLNVFHLGNNVDFHHWMLGPLLRHGGILVLHDWSLFDMVRPLFYRSLHLWEKELAFNRETDMKLQRRRNDPGFLMEHPLNRRYLEAADLVVTHTQWLADHAASLNPHLDVRYVPLAGPPLAYTPAPPHGPITVLGGIGRHKKIEWAIDAFASIVRSFPDARLRIVGRGDDVAEIRRLKAQIDRLGIGSAVEWKLNVDRATYLALIDESLLVVTMRSETAGEMSGVMVEAWGAGRVTVTSDQPQFSSFDERYCRRVSLGPRAVRELADIMADALSHPDRFVEDGRAGRELIERDFSFERVAQQHAQLIDEVARRRNRDLTGGLNVVGSWGTASGLVEVARRLGDALLDADVAITTPPGFRLEGYDATLVPRRFATLPRDIDFAVNLITANINEFHVVDPDVLGNERGRRWNIGLWIYEFPEIPYALSSRTALVDEIWTGSEFAVTAFRRYFDGPITRLHNIVRARPQHTPATVVRRRYGLRESSLVVLYTFDFNSGWARKNPLAVVAAMRDAVGPHDDVQLVMKVSGLRDPYRAELEQAIRGIDGVIIDEHLSDADLGDLFHASDVYCSLHRAEGFGLGMAEAMAIGKTVVATRYSGNLDFMNDTNSLLVDCSMGMITPADAAANPGLERIVVMGSPWAQPDHDSAVAALRRSFDPAVRAHLGPRALSHVREFFGAEAAMEIVTRRLGELRVDLERFRTTWPGPRRSA